jgi:uncharacterized protein with GYD domain
LFFITLTKWKTAPTKQIVDQATKTFGDLERQGIKIHVYWTLGRYDAVSIIEAPTEKDAMKMLLGFQGLIDTETMVAVPREEAMKLL